MRSLPFPSLALAGAVALGAMGCHAEVEPETPVGYAEVTYAPMPVADAQIEAYPHTWYEDRPVYLVNGRWWYRDNGRWAYYRNEPEHLRRTRQYVQQAPPAAEHYEYRGHYENYQAPPPQSAPPAVRVR